MVVVRGQRAQWERGKGAGFIVCGECVIVCVLLNVSLTATRRSRCGSRRSAASGVGGGWTDVGYGMFNIAPIVDVAGRVRSRSGLLCVLSGP